MEADDKVTTQLPTDPLVLAAFQQGVQRAVRGYLADVKTEPLTLAKWAKEFGIGRETATQVIPRVRGAEKFGRKWRIPLSEVPPAYWVMKANCAQRRPIEQRSAEQRLNA